MKTGAGAMKQRIGVFLGLLVLSLTLSGCDMKLPPMPWDKPVKKEAIPAEESPPPVAEEAAPPDETDFLPSAMKKLPFEEPEITLKDGMVLYGRLYDPSLKPEAENAAPATDANASANEEGYKGPKYPLVILIHGLNRTHTTWSDLPATLMKAGYAVFALDLRGHGQSTHTVKKNLVTWRLFKPEQWGQLATDVDEVIDYFQKGEDYPEVDGKTVALVGEKLGANVAVFAGRDKQAAVKGLILISPGLDYKGIKPSEAIIDYLNPALIIAGQDDAYSAQSAERLYNWLLGKKSLQIYAHIGDGSDMLTHRTSLGAQIRDWLLNTLPSGAAPLPAETAQPAINIHGTADLKQLDALKPKPEPAPPTANAHSTKAE